MGDVDWMAAWGVGSGGGGTRRRRHHSNQTRSHEIESEYRSGATKKGALPKHGGSGRSGRVNSALILSMAYAATVMCACLLWSLAFGKDDRQETTSLVNFPNLRPRGFDSAGADATIRSAAAGEDDGASPVSTRAREGTNPDNPTPLASAPNAASPSVPIGLSKRRFPKYGTADFDRVCGYMNRAGSASPPCVLYASVDSNCNEGISAWAANVAALGLYAAQSRCGIKVDYGPRVALTDVLAPIPPTKGHDDGERFAGGAVVPNEPNEGGRRVLNWTVTPDFNCTGRCAHVSEGIMFTAERRMVAERSLLRGRERTLERHLVKVPGYRFAYGGRGMHGIYRSAYENLTDLLPGFEIETGMACAWNMLFQLSPNAARYRPELFTRILPALQDEDAFVITLYMRTANADRMASQLWRGVQVTEDTTSTTQMDKFVSVCECAAQLEKDHLLPRRSAEEGDRNSGAPSSPPRISAKKIVWLVVTDSPNLSRFVSSTYDTTSPSYMGNLSTFLPRKVVTTSSSGAHSKPSIKPGTADFADGFLDWYLIGESDVVVSHGSKSYGSTGALRTARPLYHKGCYRPLLVHEE